MPTAHREICAGCQCQIEDRFLMRVMDLSWHEHCLQCCICQMPLSGSCFAMDRKLYCRIDYKKIYINSAKCSGCFHFISPNQYVIRTLDHIYHKNCFVCVACGHPLQKGDQFVVKHGQLFCRQDYENEMNMMVFSSKINDSDSYDDESDSGKPPKRARTLLTTSQKRKFKGAFEMNPKPCRQLRESLAAETGLSDRVVQVWFQNQRAKVKKIARCQNQDSEKGKKDGENGEKSKSKSPSVKNGDDSESDLSFTGNDNGLTGFTSSSEPQTFREQINGVDTDHSDSLYSSSQAMSNSIYSNSSTPMEDTMDSIDQILLTRPPNGIVCGTVINPIYKLYSMQSSYFSAE